MKKNKVKCTIEVVNTLTNERALVCNVIALGDAFIILKALEKSAEQRNDIIYILTTK